jgi:hypothetical protein
VGSGSMFVWLHRRDGGTALVQPWSRVCGPSFPRAERSVCVCKWTRCSNEKPSVPVIETTLCRGAVAKEYFVPGLCDRNVGRRADVFTKGCFGVQPRTTRTAASEPVIETVTAKR